GDGTGACRKARVSHRARLSPVRGEGAGGGEGRGESSRRSLRCRSGQTLTTPDNHPFLIRESEDRRILPSGAAGPHCAHRAADILSGRKLPSIGGAVDPRRDDCLGAEIKRAGKPGEIVDRHAHRRLDSAWLSAATPAMSEVVSHSPCSHRAPRPGILRAWAALREPRTRGHHRPLRRRAGAWRERRRTRQPLFLIWATASFSNTAICVRICCSVIPVGCKSLITL